MENRTTIDINNPKKKHPFKIDKTLNELNKERKNKTTINPYFENNFLKQYKKDVPYDKNPNK